MAWVAEELVSPTEPTSLTAAAVNSISDRRDSGKLVSEAFDDHIVLNYSPLFGAPVQSIRTQTQAAE